MGKFIINKEVDGEIVLQWETGGTSNSAMVKAKEYAEHHPNSHITVAKVIGEFDVVENKERDFGTTDFVNEVNYSLEE